MTKYTAEVLTRLTSDSNYRFEDIFARLHKEQKVKMSAKMLIKMMNVCDEAGKYDLGIQVYKKFQEEYTMGKTASHVSMSLLLNSNMVEEAMELILPDADWNNENAELYYTAIRNMVKLDMTYQLGVVINQMICKGIRMGLSMWEYVFISCGKNSTVRTYKSCK